MAENNLFPVFDVPSSLAEDTYQSSGAVYKPAPLWDFEKGDFVVNEAGQVVYGTGYDAWILWCIKTIQTQRWAHLAYSANIGTEMSEAFSQPDGTAIQSAFERTITEALLADPMRRTVQVHSFMFSWKTDSLYIQCTVLGTNGNSAALSVKIK